MRNYIRVLLFRDCAQNLTQITKKFRPVCTHIRPNNNLKTKATFRKTTAYYYNYNCSTATKK